MTVILFYEALLIHLSSEYYFPEVTNVPEEEISEVSVKGKKR